VSTEDEAAYQMAARVPEGAAVSTVWELVPHLSHREQIDTLLDRPARAPDYLLLTERPGAEFAPLFPYAAPDGWPPIYHEYAVVDGADPYRLLQLQRSLPLVPLVEPEPLPMPLSLAAYGWLDSPELARSPAVVAGQSARLMLAWRRTGTLDRRYVFFVHLLDPRTLTENGQPMRVAQNDQEPGGGRFPTIHWQSWTQPEIVLDEQRLTLPAELAPGPYEVWVGAYERETGSRVELGGPGQSLVRVGMLEVVAQDAP
nr:hypothetical protein [Ardenticatenales bacterium]